MSSQRTPKPVRSYHLIALVLLVAFFAQCAWFVASVPLTQLEVDQILRGVALLRHVPLATEPVSSPLVPLLSVAGILFHLPQSPVLLDQFWLDQHRWFIRAPFLLAGLCLALSLWYVARRLYGTPPATSCSRSLPSAPEWLRARRWPGRRSLPPGEPSASSSPPSPPRIPSMRRAKSFSGTGSASPCSASPSPSPSEPSGRLPGCSFPPPPSCCGRFRTAVSPRCSSCSPPSCLRSFCLDLCYLGDLRALAARSCPCRMARLRASVALAASARAHPRAVSSLTRLRRALLTFFRRPRRLVRSSPHSLLRQHRPAHRLSYCCSPWESFLPENGAGSILFASLPFLLLFSAGVFADLIESKLQAPALGRHLRRHCSPGRLQRCQPGAHVFTSSRLVSRWFCPAAERDHQCSKLLQATLRCSPLPPLPSAKVR